MKIKNIGPNQTQVTLANGTEVLVSYQTPVAALIPGQGYVKTSYKWSNTTSRQINKWINPNATLTVKPQEFLDSLLKSA